MGTFRLGLKDILLSGSFTLAPLILLSMYSLALIWERRNFYKRSLHGTQRFLSRLQSHIDSGEFKEAVNLCKQQPGTASNVVLASLIGSPSKDDRRKAAERVLERHLAALERGLPALGTIGSVAPFIGLFGTVLGVMRAFRDLAGAAGAGPGVVAIGISEALVATAAGLFVAIPAVVAYNYFTTRAARFADELRWTTDEILEHLTEKAA